MLINWVENHFNDPKPEQNTKLVLNLTKNKQKWIKNFRGKTNSVNGKAVVLHSRMWLSVKQEKQL